MASESGFTTQKKIGEAQHKTIHNLGSDRFGTSVSAKSLSEVNAIAAAIINSAISPDGKSVFIEITAHGARKGDVLRMSSGALIGWEFEIVEVIDADIFAIINAADSIPQIADTAKVMRWVTNKTDAEGNVNFSPGPTQFVQNGSSQQVIEDLVTPANNRPLPSGMHFIKDGIATPVRTDSVTPSNTAPMPVEIFGAGTTINLTAGDINVQTSSEGPTFDSMRIGDGSAVYLDINPDGSINAVTGGLTDAQLRATAIPVVGPLTDAQLRATAVPVLGPLTNAELRATAVPVSAAALPLPSGAATEAKQDALIAKLPSTLGQKASADSLSVVLASGTTMSVSSTTLATEAKQDSAITKLTEIDNAVDAMSLKLPSVIGQNLPADSLSVVLATGTGVTVTGGATEAKQDLLLTELQLKADLTETQPVSLASIPAAPAMVASYQEIIDLTTVAQTFIAPAGAKWCKVQTDDTNSANVRVKIGGVATAASGMQFQPGRSEDYQAAGDVSVIAESGTNQKIYVQFGA